MKTTQLPSNAKMILDSKVAGLVARVTGLETLAVSSQAHQFWYAAEVTTSAGSVRVSVDADHDDEDGSTKGWIISVRPQGALYGRVRCGGGYGQSVNEALKSCR